MFGTWNFREAVIGQMSEQMFADDDAARRQAQAESAWQPAGDLAAGELAAGELAAVDLPAGELAAGELAADGDFSYACDVSPAYDDDDLATLGWPDDEDPEQWPVADEEPDLTDPPGWLTDQFYCTDEAEQASWLASLPADVRADYLAGPYTGADEAIPVGFTHRDPGGPAGAGFAAGGALDQLAPGPSLAKALGTATTSGYHELTESELFGVLCGWQRQAAWSQAGLAAAVSAVRSRRQAQAARPGWSPLAEHVRDELAVSLRLTGRAAERLLDVTAGLDRLPDVHAALEAGVIDWPKACVFTEELAVLGDVGLARAVAAGLLGAATIWPALPVHPPLACPLRTATGIPCPFCGMTRACVAAVHGHLATSLAFNPAGVLVLAAAVVALVRPRLLTAVRVRVHVPAWFAVATVALLWLWNIGFNPTFHQLLLR